ncbi:MAG: hypothetical protein JJU33_04165 [Phycisphaerales bacterium]|nr:hypothetical protein [Phycisphaerales bacterium]
MLDDADQRTHAAGKLMPLGLGSARRLPPDERRAISSRVLGPLCSPFFVGVVLLVVLYIAALIGVVLLIGMEILGLIVHAPVAAAIAGSFLLVARGALWAGSAYLARLRAVLIERRRCPACLYSLEGIGPDPQDDGRPRVRCPECAARWDAAKLGAPIDRPIKPKVVRWTDYRAVDQETRPRPLPSQTTSPPSTTQSTGSPPNS